jgi:hypothetical protein
MDQIFHLAKNKSSKFTLLKHAYSTRPKSSKHAKMSAIDKAISNFCKTSYKFKPLIKIFDATQAK